MSYRIRDKNGIGRVSLQIPKYPRRPEQSDFVKPTIPQDFWHKNLIRIDSDCPFSKPKLIETEVPEIVPARVSVSRTLARR